jgi:transcriptional regulator with XRE-family HTH domain
MTSHDATKRNSLSDFLAALAEANPHIAETEKALGIRLTVARNVLRLRVRAGISQRELAERAGMSQPRIAEIEAANVNFGVDTLDRLAAGFGVPVDRLTKTPDGAPLTRSVPASLTRQRTTGHESAMIGDGPKVVRRSGSALAIAYDE